MFCDLEVLFNREFAVIVAPIIHACFCLICDWHPLLSNCLRYRFHFEMLCYDLDGSNNYKFVTLQYWHQVSKPACWALDISYLGSPCLARHWSVTHGFTQAFNLQPFLRQCLPPSGPLVSSPICHRRLFAVVARWLAVVVVVQQAFCS